MKLYNTFGREVQEFKPINPKQVNIYTCGPTVYDYQHIGNYSGYIYWDILIRLFMTNGCSVKRVMNITDVGHLVSDDDEGEDKLEKGAHREGKTAREVADFYTKDFFQNFNKLGLIEPEVYAMATKYINQQIDFIQVLFDKQFAYKTEQAIYFDTTKLNDYGKLTGQSLSDKETGARADVVTDKSKRNPQDFALWFFTVGRFSDHEMRWASPWGEGFPGWHLECSTIIHSTLGEPIDIHTGGIDHIGTHHTNEIAQTEAAFDVNLANFWLHNNHMMIDGQKISKSLKNGYTLKDLEKNGFTPTDFKLLVLQGHYRSQSNFTWEALAAAKTNLNSLYAWADQVFQPNTQQLTNEQSSALLQDIKDALSNDLNTPVALAKLNQSISLGAPSENLLISLDSLLGLGMSGREDISLQLKSIIQMRQQARQSNDWAKSDELRNALREQGIDIKDTASGPIWFKV